jgi:hypothetical protein
VFAALIPLLNVQVKAIRHLCSITTLLHATAMHAPVYLADHHISLHAASHPALPGAWNSEQVDSHRCDHDPIVFLENLLLPEITMQAEFS